jgi:hypothetical protein
MSFLNTQGKSNKLKLVFAGVLFIAASLFAIKTLFFSSSQITSGLTMAQPSKIADAENIKIGQINTELLASQKFKDFQEYQVKISKIEDVKKGNDNPFKEKADKIDTVKLDNIAMDKLFSGLTATLGVELTEEEKTECLGKLVKENITGNKQNDYIKSCFMDKRNKILGQ